MPVAPQGCIELKTSGLLSPDEVHEPHVHVLEVLDMGIQQDEAHADSPALRAKYPGGAAAYRPWALDPKRTLYNKYREANSWDMTTEELV